MNVLLISQEFPPETRWGGIGTYVGILAPALARAGVAVSVLSVVRGQARSDVFIDGVHVHRRPLRALPGLGRVSGMREASLRVQLAWGVRDALADLEREYHRFDVIESPEWNAESLAVTNRPVVVRLHSMAAQVFPFLGPLNIDMRVAVRLEARAIRRASLVTGTHAQIDAVRCLVGIDSTRLRQVTLPVEPVDPDAALAQSEPGRIVFVGRFEQRKAPEVLIDALTLVRKSVPHAHLVLVGRDCARPEHPSAVTWLRQRAETLGVGDAIEIVDGWAGAHAVRDELMRARVFATPSRWESFSYVAAEAAALGRPVIASDLPGMRDVVAPGETGELVATGDVSAWASAVERVLTDDGVARSYAHAGALRMATRCNPDRIAHETLAVYEEAASGRTVALASRP